MLDSHKALAGREELIYRLSIIRADGVPRVHNSGGGAIRVYGAAFLAKAHTAGDCVIVRVVAELTLLALIPLTPCLSIYFTFTNRRSHTTYFLLNYLLYIYQSLYSLFSVGRPPSR